MQSGSHGDVTRWHRGGEARVRRRLTLVGVLVAVGMLWSVQGAAARPVGMPVPVEAVSLTPDTGELALVRWQRQDRATYRLCYSPVFNFAENVWCDEVG